MKNRDVWAFNIGLDHNQWIRWLNANNSFTFSAQLFKVHVNGLNQHYKRDRPAGLLNDYFATGVTYRNMAPTGPTTNPEKLNRPGGTGARAPLCVPVSGANPPCKLRRLIPIPGSSELFTLSVNTQYWGGNLRPSVTFFYDWAGAYLFQPGIDWTFWDPFRVSIRYNLIDGNYTGSIGIFKTKDNVWLELQYLLY